MRARRRAPPAPQSLLSVPIQTRHVAFDGRSRTKPLRGGPVKLIWLAVLTVAVAVLTGVISDLVLQWVGVSRRRVPSVVAALVVAALASQVALLLAARDEDPSQVQSQGPVPANTSPPPSQTSSSTPSMTSTPTASSTEIPASEESIRRATGDTNIRLRPGYGVDLDSLDSPNWAVSDALPSARIIRQNGSRDTDVGWDEGSLFFIDDSSEVERPSYDSCAAETAYQFVEYTDTRAGDSFCVITSERRYASITVVRSTGDLLEFEAVVWDPPN